MSVPSLLSSARLTFKVESYEGHIFLKNLRQDASPFVSNAAICKR